MKEIFVALVLVFALTTAMMVTTVIGSMDQTFANTENQSSS